MNEEKRRRKIYRPHYSTNLTNPCRKKPINICRFRPGPFHRKLISGMPQGRALQESCVLRHSSVGS